MSSIFGGSTQKSTSQSNSFNQALPSLYNDTWPTISNGNNAGNQIANMLGLNGAPAQNQGFQNWQNSTGYQFGLNQGMDSITGNAAAQGLLNSGSTLKALNTYGQNYANTQYGNYTNQLQQLLGSGLSAQGILGAAGNVTNQSSYGSENKSDGGPAKFIGSLLGK